MVETNLRRVLAEAWGIRSGLLCARLLQLAKLFPRKRGNGLLSMRHVHVRVAEDHPLRFPTSKLHKRNQVAIGCIVPCGPRMSAVVWVEIDDAGALTSALKARFDLAATVGFALVW